MFQLVSTLIQAARSNFAHQAIHSRRTVSSEKCNPQLPGDSPNLRKVSVCDSIPMVLGPSLSLFQHIFQFFPFLEWQHNSLGKNPCAHFSDLPPLNKLCAKTQVTSPSSPSGVLCFPGQWVMDSILQKYDPRILENLTPTGKIWPGRTFRPQSTRKTVLTQQADQGLRLLQRLFQR